MLRTGAINKLTVDFKWQNLKKEKSKSRPDQTMSLAIVRLHNVASSLIQNLFSIPYQLMQRKSECL